MKQEKVSGSGISWAIRKSAPSSKLTTTPAPHHSVFYRPDALPAAQPTASKHRSVPTIIINDSNKFFVNFNQRFGNFNRSCQRRAKQKASLEVAPTTSGAKKSNMQQPSRGTWLGRAIVSTTRHWGGGSVAEWLACWTQAQKGPGSNRSCDAVG